MKKQISILLLTLLLTFAFAAPKTPKGTKLSVKKKFAIEGVELGSISWGKGTLTAKGEILWTETNEWQEIGWDFRGLDMSQYYICSVYDILRNTCKFCDMNTIRIFCNTIFNLS